MTPERKKNLTACVVRALCFMPFICVGIGVGWELGIGYGLASAGAMVWLDVLVMQHKGGQEQ